MMIRSGRAPVFTQARLLRRCAAIALLLLLPWALLPAPHAHAAAPVPVILDTDIEEDVDDAGVVALLNAMQDNGEAQLLAMLVNTPGKWGAPCLDAFNTYYNHPNIPIGTLKPTTDTTRSPYNQFIAQNYPNDLRDGHAAPDATTLYRTTLARQPDNSVVIVSVGLLTNLKNLLNSGPDSASALSGRDLVAQKVKLLAVMGGAYPSGGEWNFQQDPASAARVVNDWPGRMVFSGFEIGDTVYTGARMSSETPFTNPVRKAYELYVGAGNNRSSWDQTAAYYAVRGLGGLFAEAGSGGSNAVDSGTGANAWQATTAKNQNYLTKTATNSAIAQAIEDLMVQAPKFPSPQAAFVKGINFNGGAATVAGSPWLSYSAALADGLSVGAGVNTATHTLTPQPATSADETTMLRSELWKSGDMNLAQTIANGDYQIYFWVLEDYQNSYHAFDVQLEGQRVTTVRTGSVGAWSRYGPFNANVADGVLNLDLLRLQGDTLIQGMAIYKGFVQGINLNGDAVTIDGNLWQSYGQALGNGFTVGSGANTATHTVAPNPATTTAVTSMLRAELWQPGDMALAQTLANGNYQVSFWVLEDYQNNYHAFDAQLEGSTVTTVQTGNVGQWQRYGPFAVTVGDGTLNLDLRRLRGDTLIQGLLITRQGLPQ